MNVLDFMLRQKSRGTIEVAMSRCRKKKTTILRLEHFQAIATAARHMSIADARKARCVLADVRWRWTLKVLYVAAWVERNLCADPTLLNPCILRSLRRVGRCEFSARLLRH
jgi:hypothetical protein